MQLGEADFPVIGRPIRGVAAHRRHGVRKVRYLPGIMLFRSGTVISAGRVSTDDAEGSCSELIEHIRLIRLKRFVTAAPGQFHFIVFSKAAAHSGSTAVTIMPGDTFWVLTSIGQQYSSKISTNMHMSPAISAT